MQGRTWEETAKQVQGAIRTTRGAVDAMYDPRGVFNADKEFRNNPELQTSVENVVNECVARAVRIADESGDTRMLDNIADKEKFAHRVLALAKADSTSIPDASIRPTASPVGPQPPSTPGSPQLTAEEKKDLKAARADGRQVTAKDIVRVRKVMKENVW